MDGGSAVTRGTAVRLPRAQGPGPQASAHSSNGGFEAAGRRASGGASAGSARGGGGGSLPAVQEATVPPNGSLTIPLMYTPWSLRTCKVRPLPLCAWCVLSSESKMPT